MPDSNNTTTGPYKKMEDVVSSNDNGQSALFDVVNAALSALEESRKRHLHAVVNAEAN